MSNCAMLLLLRFGGSEPDELGSWVNPLHPTHLLLDQFSMVLLGVRQK